MRQKATASKACAAFAAVMLSSALCGVALADKVGVAAAVNPDAFSSLSGSPKTQLNIGKSIFFNERINTTTSGLVQVLLVDGSTFTVGPGSDLVIDKFVYDPNKKTGEIVATFTKGGMRFVGGKISKNEGGVTVNTPAGALAIRGGMFMTNGKVFAFLFGEHMTLTGKNGQSLTVFAPGNLIDTTTGEIRETKPGDIAILMAALTPGGNGGVTPGQTPPPTQTGVKAATLSNIAADIINEATATQIQDQINKEIADLSNTPTETPGETPGEPTTTPTDTGTTPTPPANTLALGYAAGAFEQTSESQNINITSYDNGDYQHINRGLMLSFSPTDVALQFDSTTKAFSGAVFNLFASDDGGAKITFIPVDISSLPISDDLKQQLGDSGIFIGAAATSTDNPNSSIVVYQHTVAGDPPTFDTNSTETVNSGAATLIGVTGNGQVFCETCDFMKWGLWLAALNVTEHPDALNEQSDTTDHTTTITTLGWWVAADSLPTIGQLPTLGTAAYDGHTIGQVVYYGDPHLARGDVHMDWDFAQRAGVLDIKNFGVPGNENVPILSASGRMDTPGIATNLTNKFSGPLLGTITPQNSDCDCDPISVSGLANGSFVANGNDKTAGAIGNFAVATSGQNPIYQASGIFGAGRNGPVDAGGHLDLPTNALNDGPRTNLLFGRSIGQ
jgi:hypothetical protein